MVKPSKKSLREAPAPPRAASPESRDGGSKAFHPEADCGVRPVAHTARRGLTAPPREIIARMLESREIDPAAGFVQLQIARLSEAMIVAGTRCAEGDVCAMGRLLELDCYDGFAKPLFRVPRKPRRHGAQSGHDANCRRRIRRPLKPGRNFSWLQSLEIARNGIGIDGRDEGGGSAVACAGSRPGSQSRISRGS
jgi:hypothetical protein